MSPQFETYLIAGILAVHLSMVAVTLFHISSKLGLRSPSRGGYWFLFVLFGGFLGYLVYWTCRVRAERLMEQYHEWCQRKFKRHP